MNAWRQFHAWPLAARFAVKSLLLLTVTFFVLFPDPRLFGTWVSRLQDANGVLDPTDPGLAEIESLVRARIPADAAPRDVLRVVEAVVYETIPYTWDWDLWGCVDYLPTTAEVLRTRTEDCDGRAVLAASILRRMGYQANLVSDILHVWVETPQGETMNPTSANKVFVATPTGTRANITPEVLINLARGTSYGIAAFPLIREIILLASIILVAMQPRSSIRRRVLGVGFLIAALVAFRAVGIDAAMRGGSMGVSIAGAAFASTLLGLTLLAFRNRTRPTQTLAEN